MQLYNKIANFLSSVLSDVCDVMDYLFTVTERLFYIYRPRAIRLLKSNEFMQVVVFFILFLIVAFL
jgi:hypothetical protein